MVDAVDTMAYAGQVPWHGLGTDTNPKASLKQWIKRAKVDWGVEKRPLYFDGVDGERIRATDQFALVRTDNEFMLSVVGKTYHEVQNEQAFEFFKKWTEAGHMTMETMGSLWYGRYVWGLARVGHDFALGKGSKADEVRAYLLILNPHIFGKSRIIMYTPTRVVCWNTLQMALGAGLRGGASAFRIPHYINPDNDSITANAEEALGLAIEQTKDFKDAATLLSKAKARPDDVEEFFCEVLKFDPKKAKEKGSKIREPKMLPLFRDALLEAPGQELPSALGTWWGALNSVTYVTDHVVGNDRETALKGAWVGHGSNLKREALELAIEKAS